MSTPAILHVRQSDGAVKSTYVHNDGYPSHTADVLKQYYDNDQLAQDLVSGGSFSFLERQMKNIERHNDKNSGCKQFRTLKASTDHWGQSYNYYWNGDEWFLTQKFDTLFPLNTMTSRKIRDDYGI